jgi:hypothetical protein
MTIHNLYIFDRHCQCIYFQKWTHSKTNAATTTSSTSNTNNNSQLGNSSSRLGGLATSSSRFSTSSSAASSVADQNSPNANSLTRSEDNHHLQTGGITQQSGLAAGSVISIEEEAKLVYGVVLSLRNFVRKLSGK